MNKPNMVVFIMMICLLCISLFYHSSTYSQSVVKTNYLFYVQKFADTLLAHGTDKYGRKHLPMWAGLIDTRDYSVPRGTKQEAERTKSGDGYFDVFDRRAVGGANIYHDLESLQVFEILSKLTGNNVYVKAADDYISAFLYNTQSEHTGLLGWGEHMYYDFYNDEVTVGGNTPESDWTHEFLPKKPIWEKLWSISPERTAKAIKGLRFHFDGPYTQTFLFNRHASWQKVNKSVDGYEGSGIEQYAYNWTAPFISHAGLFSYSFMYLFTKTNDSSWLRWSRGVGNLHWNYRNTITNLTSWDLNSRRPTGPQFGQTTQFAYRLYQAYELQPTLIELRDKALILFKAAEKYAWQENEKFYVDDLNLDGTTVKADDPRFNRTPTAPGDNIKSIRTKPVFQGNIGRVAVYFYTREKDPHFLVVSKNMIDIMERDSLKKVFKAGAIASRIHLLMDVYNVTGEIFLLELAKNYADKGIAGLWRNGLFARAVGDPYYESLGGVGSFVLSLLRIHLAK
ncbi:MAG: hypothetical protein ACXWFZ_10580, partial [Nitrososphaeraceae archaeon]